MYIEETTRKAVFWWEQEWDEYADFKKWKVKLDLIFFSEDALVFVLIL